MVEGPGEPRGKLYRLDGDGRYEICASDIAISNSICFSPNGRTMYFADSRGGSSIVTHSIPTMASCRTVNRRVFATTPAGAFPDGAQVDSDGCVWSAHWGAGQVVRYAPTAG